MNKEYEKLLDKELNEALKENSKENQEEKQKEKPKSDCIVKKRLLAGCVLLVISVVLIGISEGYRRMAEWYSTHIYSKIVSVLGRFSGIVPFSLVELCLYVFVILVIGSLIQAIVRSVRKKQGKAVMLRWFSGIFLTASVLILIFVLNCGINYRRVSFLEKTGIQMADYTAADLADVCVWLTEAVNDRASLVERDETGVMVLTEDERGAVVTAMEQLGEQYPALAGYYPEPKKVLASPVLSYLSLTGVYSAFTVEANYNRDMTDYNKPFTACHELSHLRGFMQEEEANFIAFLACKDSQRADFQYSGYLMAWIYCMNELYRADYAAWKEIRLTLNENVEADLQANSQFWDKYEGVMAEVSDKVNDTYLKANGQSEGVQSYDMMVSLVVAYYLSSI